MKKQKITFNKKDSTITTELLTHVQKETNTPSVFVFAFKPIPKENSITFFLDVGVRVDAKKDEDFEIYLEHIEWWVSQVRSEFKIPLPSPIQQEDL